jgi:glycosyltransferase 2 family protein
VGGLRVILAVCGFLLLGYLVGQLGVDALLAAFERVRWAAPLLLVPSLLWHVSNTVAWSLAFPPDRFRPGLPTLFMARLAGETVNQVTPLANLGGEPVKAYLLRHRTPGPRGVATVVIDKMAQLIVGLVFTVLGLMLLLAYQERSFALPVGPILVLAAVLVAGAVGLWWFHRRQERLFSSLLKYLRCMGVMVQAIERNMGRAERIDASIRSFHDQFPWRFVGVVAFQSIGWLLGTLETYLVLGALSNGFDLPFCFMLTSLGSIINALFFFMPSSFGVMEGGQVVLFGILGLDPAMGLSMALIKRIRRLLWIGVGWMFLSCLSRRAARGRKAASVAPVRVPS